MLTDTHAHLYLEDFKDDIDVVIERAKTNNITRFFLPNIDSSTIADLLRLTEKHSENIFPMMGLHPCSVTQNFEEELRIVEDWHSKQKFYAVGEIGIDLHWDKTFIEEQKTAFRKQIELAKKLQLPIVIHVRNSFEEVFEIVDELNDEILSGIFHCFTGNLEQAQKIINYGGFKLGVGGIVTFKNAGIDNIVKQIDLKHIVLETDSPYLAPVPYRGKRNESSYLIEIAKKVAQLHGVSLEKVAEITTANSKEIYRI